ncbi:FACT complex subunit SPT16 [Bulinus truncatus]|nr:FACT complex subunit SPT16 [Bulinus truncatus]
MQIRCWENTFIFENALKYVTGVDSSQLDVCYSAIIQSGGKYSLKFSTTSDENNLQFDAIVCAMGADTSLTV